MNFRKIIPILLTFFLSLSSLFSAEKTTLHGKALSDQVYNTVKACGVKAEIESIITSVPNQFPYNVSVSFKGINQDVENDDKIFHATIFIPQENASANPDFVKKLISAFSDEKLFCDVKIVFVYGSNIKSKKQNYVNGYERYLLNTEINDSMYFILNKDGETTKFESFSSSHSSSSVLVSSVFSAFLENKVYISNSFFISQMTYLPLFTCPDLDWFFNEGKDCIKVTFSQNEDTDNIVKVIRSFISDNLGGQNDNHSIIIKTPARIITLSEQQTLYLFFFVIIITLVILFGVSIVNKNFGFHSWKKITKIWYYPFASFFICGLCFIFFRKGWIFFINSFNLSLNIFSFLVSVLAFIFVIESIICVTLVNFPLDYKRHTIDYLILYSTGISMFLFSITDISLLPMYFALFAFSLIPIFIKTTYISIIQLILFHIPLYPWIKTLFTQADPLLLENTVYYGKLFPWILALNLTSIFLVWFRILASLNFHLYKKNTPVSKKLHLSLGIVASCLIANSILMAIFFKKPLSENVKISEESLTSSVKVKSQDDISITYKDKKLFGETIRTLKIVSKREIVSAELQVTGKTASPVIFSDNDNILIHNRTTEFLIPSYPPKNMEFSYGTDSSNDTAVIMTCWFYDEEDGNLEQSQKSIIIRGRR